MYDHYLTVSCAAGLLQRGTKQMTDKNRDHDLIKALDAWDQHHATLKGGTLTATIDVCATYNLARPVLVALNPFLSFIPVFGPRIVPIIQALMAGLDTYCKTNIA